MVTLAARFRSTPWKRLVGCGHSAWGKLADAPVVRGKSSPLTSDDPRRVLYIPQYCLFLGIVYSSVLSVDTASHR